MVHAVGVAFEGGGEDGGEACGWFAAEGSGGGGVPGAGGGLRAIDAWAPLDDVEVELEDALLAEDEFGDGDEGGFSAFAQDGAAGAEEEVFDELLGEGGGSAGASSFHVFGGVDLDLAPVEAVVLVETAVFRGDDGVLEIGRDLAEGNEGGVLTIRLVVNPGLEAALDLNGGGGRVDKARGDEQEGGEKPESDESGGEREGDQAERGTAGGALDGRIDGGLDGDGWGRSHISG